MKKILNKIPGFRSNILWKKIISVIGHISLILIMMPILTNTDKKSFTQTDSVVNTITNVISVLLIIVIPYILITNLFGIRNRLPIFRKKTIFSYIIGFALSAIILLSLFGICTSMVSVYASPELKEALRLERESRDAANAKIKAEKEAVKKEAAEKKEAEKKEVAEKKEAENKEIAAKKEAEAKAKEQAESEAKAQADAAKKAEQEAQAEKERLSNIVLEYIETKTQEFPNLVLIAKDKKSGIKLWEKTWAQASKYNKQIFENENILYISVLSNLYALNKETGEEIFKYEGIALSDFILKNNIIYCIGRKPFITAIKIDGSILWQHSTFNSYWAESILSVNEKNIEIKCRDNSLNPATVVFDIDGNHIQTKLDPKIEFMNSCTPLDYEAIIRYPDQYSNKNYIIFGKVDQVIEEKGNNYLLNIAINPDKYGFSDKSITVEYIKNASDPRIVEDDILTVWGIFKGIKSYQRTINNSEVLIAHFQGKYIEIK